jgi:hypothetical protein
LRRHSYCLCSGSDSAQTTCVAMADHPCTPTCCAIKITCCSFDSIRIRHCGDRDSVVPVCWNPVCAGACPVFSTKKAEFGLPRCAACAPESNQLVDEVQCHFNNVGPQRVHCQLQNLLRNRVLGAQDMMQGRMRLAQLPGCYTTELRSPQAQPTGSRTQS